MPPVSAKNTPLSGAATDLGLGLGDQLAQQTADETDDLRQRMLTDQGVGLSASARTLLGPMKPLV